MAAGAQTGAANSCWFQATWNEHMIVPVGHKEQALWTLSCFLGNSPVALPPVRGLCKQGAMRRNGKSALGFFKCKGPCFAGNMRKSPGIHAAFAVPADVLDKRGRVALLDCSAWHAFLQMRCFCHGKAKDLLGAIASFCSPGLQSECYQEPWLLHTQGAAPHACAEVDSAAKKNCASLLW
eukprot:1146016-Pelagomonas_calceolata.AAC.13